MTDKNCGTCRLWAHNFYNKQHPSLRGTGCCADVKMDIPASWSSNAPMLASDGEDCIAWEENHPIHAEVAEPFGRESDIRPGFYEDDLP